MGGSMKQQVPCHSSAISDHVQSQHDQYSNINSLRLVMTGFVFQNTVPKRSAGLAIPVQITVTTNTC